MKRGFSLPASLGRSSAHLKGFTLIEALLVVSVMGILGALSASLVTDTRKHVELLKLKKDVRSVNTAIKAYKSFGGSLDSAITIPQILAKLKSRADALSAEQTAGLTGNFIDLRLALEVQSPADANSSEPRALWNAAKQQFEVATRGRAGVRFVLDESLAAAVLTESRQPVMKLATRDEWIWDYVDTASPMRPYATGIPLVRRPIPLPTPLPAGTPPAISPRDLRPPLFSIAAGSYPITRFNLQLELADPNPAGVSLILYSLNSGSWRLYTGTPLNVSPSTEIGAYCASADPNWRNSEVDRNSYAASPVQLAIPLISASASAFNYAENQSVEISLNDLNDPDVSTLQYHQPDVGWKDYNGPFSVKSESYPGGLNVKARAVAIAEYYLDSGEASLQIGSAKLGRLQPPAIHLTPDTSGTGTLATVSLENPNPEGTSTIYFRLVPVPSPFGCDLIQGRAGPEEFLAYSAPFSVSEGDIPDNFAVIAYCKSMTPGFLDSGFSIAYREEFTSGLRGGHFDVDTSSFIAPLAKGSTDGHVHAFDNKYNTDVVDFFNLPDEKLHNIAADIAGPGVKFKLIVVNADLTPDARLSINTAPGTGGVPGTTYDDTPVASLPVYSLGGVPGTTKLENLAFFFESNAITGAGLIPTNTGDVRKNVPGKNGEWRNGAFTIQAVRVNDDGSDAFGTNPSLSAGDHGPAISGLLWEATVFWHWKGPSYHEAGNDYVPHDPVTVREGLEGNAEDPVCAF